MTSRWKKAGKKALTSFPCWLMCSSASPEAADFGVIPAWSSALAQASCGKGVRALAQLLQHWEKALARTQENSWAEKSILQSRTTLSNSDMLMVTALLFAERWAPPCPQCLHPPAPWGSGQRWTPTQGTLPWQQDLDLRLTPPPCPYPPHRTAAVPIPMQHCHHAPRDVPCLCHLCLPGSVPQAQAVPHLCLPGLRGTGCGPGTPSLHSHCSTKLPGWGQQWLQAAAQEQD